MVSYRKIVHSYRITTSLGHIIPPASVYELWPSRHKRVQHRSHLERNAFRRGKGEGGRREGGKKGRREEGKGEVTSRGMHLG